MNIVSASLLEMLSRFEIPYAMCDNCSYRTKVHWLNRHMILTFENNKHLTELHMRDVCIRIELRTRCLCWDRTANMLMVRVQNYESNRLCGNRCGQFPHKTWHWKFISRHPNVCASKEQRMSSTNIEIDLIVYP